MAVIKYYVSCMGMRNAVYEEIHDPCVCGVPISKEKAMAIIDKKGLVRALTNEFGIVWDTPDRAFYNEFKGATVKR